MYSLTETVILDDIVSLKSYFLHLITSPVCFIGCPNGKSRTTSLVNISSMSKLIVSLLGPLAESRTIIVATNSVALLLPHAAFSVGLQDGRVATAGPPAKVHAALRDMDLGEKVGEVKEQLQVPNAEEDVMTGKPPTPIQPTTGVPGSYFTAMGGYWLAILIFIAFVISQIVEVVSKNVIRVWADPGSDAKSATYYLIGA